MTTTRHTQCIVFAGMLLLAASSAHAVPMTFAGTQSGGNLNNAVDGFRAFLGEPNNGNALGVDADPNGRREINWDAGIVPFNMPGDFFNTTVPRGAEFSTPGSGFRVSNDGIDNEFDSFNAGYPDQFQTFSAPRLFTPFENNTLDVNFFVSGTDTSATSLGFGAIFTDVDSEGSTTLEFFDQFGNALISPQVVATDPQGLSFLGVGFDDADLFRVLITSGNTAITGTSADDDPAGGVDVVVIDDLFYGEPRELQAVAVPTPGSLSLFGFGLSLLLLGAGRRRARRPVARGSQA